VSSAFKEWGYAVATREYRDQVVTERESWIIDNKDKGVDDIVKNCESIEPGYSMMTDAQQKVLREEVEGVISKVRRFQPRFLSYVHDDSIGSDCIRAALFSSI
jgi:isocitrate dehydrogenase